MRSKTAKRIMDETPQEIKKKAQEYGDKLVLYEVSKSFYCFNDSKTDKKCTEQCLYCLPHENKH